MDTIVDTIVDTLFRLPELGEGVAEGTVVGIAVAAGDEIEKDQVLFEVETDKVVMEIPADRAGRIGRILIESGAVVHAGDALLEFESSAAAAAQEPPPVIETVAQAEPVNVPSAAPAVDQIPAQSAASAAAEMAAASPARAEVLPFRPASTILPAGPSVRRLARELGVELAQVKGRGPQGRISKDDVKEFARLHMQQPHTAQPHAAIETPTVTEPAVAEPAVTEPAVTEPAVTEPAVAEPAVAERPAVSELPDFSAFGASHREPLSTIQQATRNNMSRAWREIPHAWLQHQADIAELEQQRRRYKNLAQEAGVSLSITPFIVKALALALQRFPLFNACLDEAGNAVVYRDYIDIGVAVDSERGLLVPVVRQAAGQSILQIAGTLDDLTARARGGKLALKEMQGAGITLSNLGNMGVTSIYPIINWPQVAIVGVAAAQWQQCRGGDGEWREKLLMPLTLAFDHRIINGADAARFLEYIRTLLEQPFRFCL